MENCPPYNSNALLIYFVSAFLLEQMNILKVVRGENAANLQHKRPHDLTSFKVMVHAQERDVELIGLGMLTAWSNNG